ncbi:hypothetical protein QJS10_CPA16g00429 [Acorus calamus]|uniref:FAD-binding FR-type domain-containing protein n=1 Tax=Acorus calamus TaxID=4465 RepID=A0AAV9D0H2_ACOCL|nr:hypothetical protein QJS10_CPA16g00429 [Acorus calamus]
MFILFLAWTYYTRISHDFKKMTPNKSLHLNRWQLKFMMVGIRFGSLTEACLALLLLPILRGMSLLRLLGIQFEASVRYHVWLGNAVALFSVVHGTCIMFIWGVKKSLANEMSKWQRTGRVYLAGELALLVGLVIWITSLPQLRRRSFQIFYFTHHLYIIFIIFFLLHTGDRHFYMVFPAVLLFALDKLLRIIQSRHATCVISASVLSCKAVELTLLKSPGMKYTPTSTVFIKIPQISRFQWHPFSITSSCCTNDDEISVTIKCYGEWTDALYNMIHEKLKSDPHHMECFPIAIEGPYGPENHFYERYKNLILVAGGTGITPFLSIIRGIASRNNNMDNLHTRIQLVYVVRKSQDLSMLTSISPLLFNWPSEAGELKLMIHVTQEERSVTTVREVLLETTKAQRVYFDTNCGKYSASRPLDLTWMVILTGLSFIVFLTCLVCLNHAFIHQGKKGSKLKTPSWISNVMVICSFIIATSCSVLVMILFGYRKSENEIGSVIQNHEKDHSEMDLADERGSVEKHDIHFGKRPNLLDVLSEIPIQTEESNVGVLVCGPESMQEAVALFCNKSSHRLGDSERQPNFCFHAINFSL